MGSHYESMDELELRHKYFEGDPIALTELLRRYESDIRTTIYCTLQQYGVYDVDDLYQETCIKLHTRYEKYDPEYSWRAWAKTIAHNTVRDRWRRSRNDVATGSGSDEPFGAKPPTTDEPPPLERVLLAEAIAAMQECMQRIPIEYREMLLLWLEEEPHLTDLAKRFSIPYDTFRRRFQKQLNDLKQCINARLGGSHDQ